MTIIQAHRRTKNHDVQLGAVTLKFRPNELGHVICDVTDPKHVEILLNIPTGFRAYGEQPEAPPSPLLTAPPAAPKPLAFEVDSVPPAAPPAAQSGEIPTNTPPADAADEDGEIPSSPYVLRNPDGTEYDLRPLNNEQLHAFCAANGITAHPNAKDDTIRKKIVAHFSKAE